MGSLYLPSAVGAGELHTLPIMEQRKVMRRLEMLHTLVAVRWEACTIALPLCTTIYCTWQGRTQEAPPSERPCVTCKCGLEVTAALCT